MSICLLLNYYLFLFDLVCIIEYKLWQFCKIKKIITTFEKRGNFLKQIKSVRKSLENLS